MITRVEILNYKSLKYIDINLKPFAIMVGPNGSGKSTFLDIFALLRDIMTENVTVAVERRCSHFKELTWKGKTDSIEIAIEFKVPEKINEIFQFARYEICIGEHETDGIIIKSENLYLIKENDLENRKEGIHKKHNISFPSESSTPKHIIIASKGISSEWRKIISKSSKGNDSFFAESTGWKITFKFGKTKSALSQVPEDPDKFPVTLWVKKILTESIHFLQLNSPKMKWPCRPDAPVLFQTDGSNMPKVIKNLEEKHDELFENWIEHIRTAIPEIDSIEINKRPEDRYLYINVIQNNKAGFKITEETIKKLKDKIDTEKLKPLLNKKFLREKLEDRLSSHLTKKEIRLVLNYTTDSKLPSWLLSDGTLRLLAQTLIAYLPEEDQLYLIEEPENGLHPLAIESVYQSLSSVYENQVFLATHSTALVRLAKPENIYCFAKTENGTVDIVEGNNHPRLKDWKKGVDLGTLHGTGVLQ